MAYTDISVCYVYYIYLCIKYIYHMYRYTHCGSQVKIPIINGDYLFNNSHLLNTFYVLEFLHTFSPHNNPVKQLLSLFIDLKFFSITRGRGI